MTKRQALVLTLIAVALTAFSAALSRRDSRDWRESRSRRLLPFPWQDAAKAVIVRPDGTIAISKDAEGRWLLELPGGVTDVLNPNVTESLAALATLAWRERAVDREGAEAAGVGAPGFTTTLTVDSVAGERVSIALGGVRNGLRSAVVDGDAGVVHAVNQNLAAFLDWPGERFRSMLLAAPGGGAKPTRIRLSPDPLNPDLDIALEESPAGWRMTEPVEWPVDPNRLDILLRWFDRLRADGIAAEMTGDPEYFGFGEKSPRVEVWYPANGARAETRRRIEFGREADDGGGEGRLYARELSRSPVFTIPRDAIAEISLDAASGRPEAWRNFFRQRSLDRVGNEVPARIVVEQLLPRPAKLTITNSPAGWTGTLEEGRDGEGGEGGEPRTFVIDPPDARDRMLPLTALFTGLAGLRVKNFLADAEPGAETLRRTACPAWKFSMTAADGRELPGLTLYARDASGALPGGAPYADDKPEPQEPEPARARSGDGAAVPPGAGIAFSVPDRAAVMETFAELAYLLCLPPYRYQSRRLIDADAKEWGRVVIRTGQTGGKTFSYRRKLNDINEQWWRGGAAGAPDEPLLDDNNRLVSVLQELSQLRAEGFVRGVSGGAANFGLDRPAITAIVYSSPEQAGSGKGDSPLFTLTLGDEVDASGRRYARLGGDGPVFVAPARISRALGLEYR